MSAGYCSGTDFVKILKVVCILDAKTATSSFRDLATRGIVRAIPLKEATMPTLEQIQEKMKKLQAQAELLIARRAQSVLGNIRKLMEEHGITTADINAHSPAKKKPGRSAVNTPQLVIKQKSVARPVAKGKLPPKYRDPKTGATWSGKARPPSWIANAKDRSKFLIANAADGAFVASSGVVSKAKATSKKASAVSDTIAHTGHRKGTQPAKYLDPRTGASWSGRGPAPAWLAAAKDRTKYLIDGVNAAAAETSAASKKGRKPKSTVTPRSVSGNAAAGKADATKKTAAAKKTTTKKPAIGSKKVAGKKAAATMVKKPVKKLNAKPEVTVVPETTPSLTAA
jgi:DNA-binding protein H-NS